MIGLEISCNGKRVIVAGGDRVFSVSSVVNVLGKLGENIKKDFEPFGNLTVLGISEPHGKKPQQMITWNHKTDLSVGDEIKIRIVEIEKPTKATDIQDIEEKEDQD